MSGRRSVMARITALTATIVTTLAMSRLTATVVCVLAAVWGASAAHAQSVGAEAYGEVSTAVSQSFQRLIAAVLKVLPAAISAIIVLAVFWVLATLVRRVARAGAQYIDDQTTRLLVTQVTYYLVWAVGFMRGARRRRREPAVRRNRARPGQRRDRLCAEGHPLESRQRHPHSRNAPIRDRR